MQYTYMMGSKKHITLIGKAISKAARMRGGGSALPGLVVEKLDDGFLLRTLSQLPHGVVIVSGTNGKTTTTKMVTSLLRSQGLKVFTNQSGSNFIRGIIASLLMSVDNSGVLDADIAVLELDEAHAVHFVKKVPPRYVLLLNVMRDQLDRFGEIDLAAGLLQKVACSATEGVVLNRDDPRVAAIARVIRKPVHVAYFGISPELQKQFPHDDDLHEPTSQTALKNASRHPNDLVLQSFHKQTATLQNGAASISVVLAISGIYNVLNATAALAFARMIVGLKRDNAKLLQALSAVTPAFGRGESFVVAGQPLEIVLVKNPAGFRLGLQSFGADNFATMIAINDQYADGRDVSWLWDVDFSSLGNHAAVTVGGIRAYDMALRLQYDGVGVGAVGQNVSNILKRFLADHPNKPKRIFCTYTAMLAIRRQLKKYVQVADFA